MRDDPGLDAAEIATSLRGQYGVHAASITFLPLGYDLATAVYEVRAFDGAAWFVKARFGPVSERGVQVPTALVEAGIANVLAPVRARSGALWCALDGTPAVCIVLFPFIRGRTAQAAGLSDDQWRTFGSTLRAVHDSGLAPRFRDLLGAETFTLPTGAKLRRVLDAAPAHSAGTHGAGPHDAGPQDAPARRLVGFLRAHEGRIRALLARAEDLGARLRARPFEAVLCHADIHAANILVADDGAIFLTDWDGPPGPLIAPRERDLLFVVGSRIARAVEPREEGLFFAGYGRVAIDPDALVYYRYERIVEDLGEFGATVLLDPEAGDAVRAEAAEIVEGFFAPGGIVEGAEDVVIR